MAVSAGKTSALGFRSILSLNLVSNNAQMNGIGGWAWRDQVDMKAILTPRLILEATPLRGRRFV